jgi:class 3 adenylate cyclase
MSTIDPAPHESGGNLVAYRPGTSMGAGPLYLIHRSDDGSVHRFVFFERVEIGRHQESREVEPGVLMLKDPTVSRRHCEIVQTAPGRCTLRDVSRNGTWLDGRRLLPNIEFDFHVGQVMRVGAGHEFHLAGGSLDTLDIAGRDDQRTQSVLEYGEVAILVGDIAGYTSIVQHADPARLHRSVERLFHEIEETLIARGASLKEHQGDAVFAYWSEKHCPTYAETACAAALDVDALARRLAQDTSIWNVPNFPLRMEWAIATGGVAIKSTGGDHPTGLAMVGEPVILAFRLEKLANEERGTVLVCPRTRSLTDGLFVCRDVGELRIDGFAETIAVTGLVGHAGGRSVAPTLQ